MRIDIIEQLVQARLEDAQALYDAGRFDGSVYLCGYALELGLKARICRHLQWEQYPPTGGGRDYASFKTHNLAVLLNLTGLENHIKLDSSYCADWSIVAEWSPESRYTIAEVSGSKAQGMLESTNIILEQLL